VTRDLEGYDKKTKVAFLIIYHYNTCLDAE
jgi:hypothetical protein